MGNETSSPSPQVGQNFGGLNDQELKNREIQKLDQEMKKKIRKGINYTSNNQKF